MKVTRTGSNTYKAETEHATYFITNEYYRTWEVEKQNPETFEFELIYIAPSKEAAIKAIKWEEEQEAGTMASRTDTINRMCEIAIELTENYDRRVEEVIWNMAYDFNDAHEEREAILVCQTDDGIGIEDDLFRFDW